jgi:hypothetical protein
MVFPSDARSDKDFTRPNQPRLSSGQAGYRRATTAAIRGAKIGKGIGWLIGSGLVVEWEKDEGYCYWNSANRETLVNYIFSLRPPSPFLIFAVFVFFCFVFPPLSRSGVNPMGYQHS